MQILAAIGFDPFDLIGHLRPSTELINFLNHWMDALFVAANNFTLGIGGVWRGLSCGGPNTDPIAEAWTDTFRWVLMLFGTNC
jgi:hypothetical protein